MLEITLNCPECGAPNSVPVEEEAAHFICEACGVSSAISETLSELAKVGTDPLLGAVISECEIIEKVGEGGFGAVYKALDRNLQRPVALKILLQSLTSNQEFVQKFIREAITAAQLNHPHIVAIHKVGRDEQRGLHYLIMEFLDGRTLAEVIEQDGKIPLERATNIVLQACEALAVAQEKKIIHRDIKPENLMVDDRGNVKITDFGLAKVVNPDMRSTKVVGTPHYMSPEQFEGRAIDGRTDIYSLGVTFYYMITREKPYQGTNTVQVIYSILTSEPRSPLEIDEGIPAELWTVIQKMIAKSPDDRYQTFQEVRADLLRFRDRSLRDGISCPRCGADNPDGRKFCRECGDALVSPCPGCGAEEAAGTKHCGQCGANVEALLALDDRTSRADLLRSKGEVRKALRLYDEIINIEPDHPQAQEARRELSQVVEQIDGIKEETSRLVDAGQIDDALGKLDQAIAMIPAEKELVRLRTELQTRVTEKAVAAHRMVADDALAKHDYVAAADALRTALDLDPDDPELRLQLRGAEAKAADLGRALTTAREMFDGQQYDLAYAASKEALSLSPDDEVAADIHARAKSFLDSTESFVERGQAMLDEGRYEDARLEFESALEVRPDDTQVAQLREDAVAHLEKFDIAVIEVQGLIGKGDDDAALKWLDDLEDERSFDPRIAEMRASIDAVHSKRERDGRLDKLMLEGRKAEKAGDLERALTTYEKAIAQDPENERATDLADRTRQRISDADEFERLATEHESEGNLPQAIAALNRLGELRRNDPGVRSRLANCQKKLDRLEKALKKAESALQKKKLDDARDHALRVLELSPRSRRAERVKAEVERLQGAIKKHILQADARIASELFDDALASLSKAEQLGADPKSVAEMRDRAETGKISTLKADATRSFRFENFEAAMRKYEQVLELSDGDPEAVEGRKRALKRLIASRRESPWIKLVASLLLFVGLGAIQLVAVSLPPSSVRASGLEGTGEGETEIVEAGTGVNAPWKGVDKERLQQMALARDWDALLNVIEGQEAEFATHPSVVESRRWVEAMKAAGALEPKAILGRLAEIEAPDAESESPLTAFAGDVGEVWRKKIEAEIRASSLKGDEELVALAEAGRWDELLSTLAAMRDSASADDERARYAAAAEFANAMKTAEATPTVGKPAAVVEALVNVDAPAVGMFGGETGEKVVTDRIETAASPLLAQAEGRELAGKHREAGGRFQELQNALQDGPDRNSLAALLARTEAGKLFNAAFANGLEEKRSDQESLENAHDDFLKAYRIAGQSPVRRDERREAAKKEFVNVQEEVRVTAWKRMNEADSKNPTTSIPFFESFALYRRLYNAAARELGDEPIDSSEADAMIKKGDGR